VLASSSPGADGWASAATDEPAAPARVEAPAASGSTGSGSTDSAARLTEDAAALAEDAAGLAGDAAQLAGADGSGSGGVPAPRPAGTEPATGEAAAEARPRPDARGVFDAATTRRRSVVFEEDDELDVPDFLK
jgi:cell division protein FtsZ